MSNVNQAFIKVYRGRDGSVAAEDQPASAASASVQQAQGTCVVGVWTGDGESAADAAADEAPTRNGEPGRAPLSGPMSSASHLPAVLAAVAAAGEPDLSEVDDRSAGVEYLRPFVPLPERQDAAAQPATADRAASHFRPAQASPAPRARVIVMNEPAHAVPAPHFDVAAVAGQSGSPEPVTHQFPSADVRPTAMEERLQDAEARLQQAETRLQQAEDRSATTPERPEEVEERAVPKSGPPESPNVSAADAGPGEGPFRPAWEIDSFEWSDTVGQLFADQPDRFDLLAERVIQLADAGSRRIAIIGSCPGAGSTTLALCLARRLSEVVQEIALVDGNVGNPSLADNLDVRLEAGWEEVLTGRQITDEVAVTSVGNGITLLPLLNVDLIDNTAAVALRAAEVQQRLVKNHDLVLVDAGPVWGKGIELLTGGENQTAVDAAVLVRDVRQTAERELNVAIAELASRGIAVVAIVENYQSVAATESVRKAA